MNSARLEASRTFMTKRREYLKDQINELETNGKNKMFIPLSVLDIQFAVNIVLGCVSLFIVCCCERVCCSV
jgi:hypothetical protein